MGIDRYAVSPGGPKGRQAQETETIAHNSVFAGHREAGYNAVDRAPAGSKAPGV